MFLFPARHFFYSIGASSSSSSAGRRRLLGTRLFSTLLVRQPPSSVLQSSRSLATDLQTDQRGGRGEGRGLSSSSDRAEPQSNTHSKRRRRGTLPACLPGPQGPTRKRTHSSASFFAPSSGLLRGSLPAHLSRSLPTSVWSGAGISGGGQRRGPFLGSKTADGGGGRSGASNRADGPGQKE